MRWTSTMLRLAPRRWPKWRSSWISWRRRRRATGGGAAEGEGGGANAARRGGEAGKESFRLYVSACVTSVRDSSVRVSSLSATASPASLALAGRGMGAAAAVRLAPRRALAALAVGLAELADFHYRLFDMLVALTLFACLLCLTLLPLHSLQSMLLFNKNFWKVIVRRMDLADFLADTYQR